MRVLYVAPRYHTNQIPVMKGWLNHGHQVRFISQFAGTSEDYSVLRPVVLGYSLLFEGAMRLYRLLFCRREKSEKREFDLRTKAGFPPLGSVRKMLSDFEPELVIVRERSVYNVPFTLYCKRKGIPVILYNQSPLWDEPGGDDWLRRRIFRRFLPQKRMTPVLGTKGAGKVRRSDAFYVPFVAEPRYSMEEKEHFADDRTRILCVGRYEERKNLLLLVEAISPLASVYPLRLAIAGELADQRQREYYERLVKLIREKGLEECVALYRNLSRERVYEEYRRADLFVLPSTRERASVSQLEAMSCSLPIVCSDTNGSACYVEDGVNGRLFRDNDRDDLREKLETLVSDRESLLRMGGAAYRSVKEKYGFLHYYRMMLDILANDETKEMEAR